MRWLLALWTLVILLTTGCLTEWECSQPKKMETFLLKCDENYNSDFCKGRAHEMFCHPRPDPSLQDCPPCKCAKCPECLEQTTEKDF
jgi:hypothetical protein